MSMNLVVHTALSALVILALVAVVIYGLVLLIALLGADSGLGGKVRKALATNPELAIGVPCASIAAIAIVSAMLKAFQPEFEGNTGQLSFTAFDMQFSGPSGPVTLWVVCFLAIIAAIRLLRR